MPGRGLKIARRWVVGVTVAIMMVACSADRHDDSHAVVVPPTRTLTPPTLTPTVETMPATPTPTDLPSPSTLTSTGMETTAVTIPPVVQTFMALTTQDLVEQQGAAPTDIRLLSVDAFVWHGASWDCQTRPASPGTGPGITHGYRIVFSAGNRAYVYHTDTRSTFFLCEDTAWLALEGKPVVVDPIARAMVDLVVQDAAQRIKVPDSEIELTGLLTLAWPDTSLGCPKPGADYQDTPTLGYRIMLHAAKDTIIYHTSTRDFVRCTPEEEILPGIIREAIPPTPIPQ